MQMDLYQLNIILTHQVLEIRKSFTDSKGFRTTTLRTSRKKSQKTKTKAASQSQTVKKASTRTPAKKPRAKNPPAKTRMIAAEKNVPRTPGMTVLKWKKRYKARSRKIKKNIITSP